MASIGLSIFSWLALCGIILIILGGVTFVRLFKLNSYIKKNHHRKWKEITSLGKFGPGLSNPFRAWPYIFNNTKETDEKLLRLKNSAKMSLRYFLIMFGMLVLSLIAGFTIMYSISN